jgi:hypothetical protein
MKNNSKSENNNPD